MVLSICIINYLVFGGFNRNERNPFQNGLLGARGSVLRKRFRLSLFPISDHSRTLVVTPMVVLVKFLAAFFVTNNLLKLTCNRIE